ncbi:MAG: septation protein A [Burkholderiales bacterium]|nr:septation protein A [Burkholderiales bacterium]
MKFLFDIFPVILFFAAFKFFGIYVATTVAIIATVLQIGWVWFKQRKVESMQWISLALIVVFGGATLLLRDETFIKWKPTVLYWLFAVTLLVSEIAFRKNLIKSMMDKQVSAPEGVWKKLLFGWIGFFVVMGVLNLYVAYSYSTDTWVSFKLFGGIGLMLVFVLGQAVLLAPHMKEKEAE